MKEAVRIKVHGRVQGVGFRYYTCRQARELGLEGWVRNERDGSVLVHIQGAEELVQSMHKWLERGPSSARVEQLVAIPAAFDSSLIDFEITY